MPPKRTTPLTEKQTVRLAEHIKQLNQIRAQTKAFKQHLDDSSLYADKLVVSLSQLNQEAMALPQYMKQFAIGSERLSTQLGYINNDVVDFSKNLIKVKHDYMSLSQAGKYWLNSINFKSIYTNASKALNEHRGLFLGTYTKLTSVMTGLASNSSKLGSDGFVNMTNAVRELDAQLIKAKTNISKMMDSKQYGDINRQIKSSETKIANARQKEAEAFARSKASGASLKDQTKQAKIMAKQRSIIETNKANIEKLYNIKKNALPLERSQIEAAHQAAEQLQKQRDHAASMNRLQISLNQKMKPINKAVITFGQGADRIKTSMSHILRGLPGISQGLTSISFKDVAVNFNGMLSDMVFASAAGFDKIKQSGGSTFDSIAAGALSGFKGLIGGLVSMFTSLFKMLTVSAIAMITALFMSALQFRDRLQQAYMSVQRGSGAISGEGQLGQFGKVYEKTGGLIGGQKTIQIYNTFRKVSDTVGLVGQQVQFLERRLGVTATVSSTFLQNMKYVYGMSEEVAGSFAVLTAKAANLQGVLPQRILKAMSQATGQTTIYLGKSSKTLVKSALFAAKMNMSMQDMLKAAKGLDDIQKSIQRSMQLQLLTGQKIDIGQMIRLNALGKGPEAVAMMFDQLGPAVENALPVVKNLMTQFMGGIDFNVMKGAYQQTKKSGLSFQQQLAKSAKVAQQISNKSASGVMQDTRTRAWALLSDLQALQLKIQQIVYKHFNKFVTMFYGTTGTITDLFDGIVGWVSDKLQKLLNWISQAKNQNALKNIFDTAVVVGERFIQVAHVIGKVVKWVYDKFGAWGIIIGAVLITNLSAAITIVSAFGNGILFLGKALLSIKFAGIASVAQTVALKFMYLAGGIKTFIGVLAGGIKTVIGGILSPIGLVVGAIGSVVLAYKTISRQVKAGNGSIESRLKLAKGQLDLNTKVSESLQRQMQYQQQHSDKTQKSIDIFKQLSKKKNLSVQQTYKLKAAYIELLGQQQGMKAFKDKALLTNEQLQSSEDKIRQAIEKKNRIEQDGIKTSMALRREQLKQKIMSAKLDDSTVIGRLFNQDKALNKQLQPDFLKARALAASGNTSQAEIAFAQLYQKYRDQHRKERDFDLQNFIIEQLLSTKQLLAIDNKQSTVDVGRLLRNSSYKVQNTDISKLGLATGGIVDKPHLGLVGQAGAEAIIPLRKSVFQDLGLTNTDNQSSSKQSENLIGKIAAAISSVTHAVDNKPIQITLNLDGKPLAQYLLKNGVVSQRLG